MKVMFFFSFLFQFKPQAVVFDLTTNTKFDMAIMLFIGLNMMVMAMDHYQMEPTFDLVLERLNVFFIAIFTTECVLKLFAFRWYYFKEPWNVFDFVVVSLSILGKFLELSDSSKGVRFKGNLPLLFIRQKCHFSIYLSLYIYVTICFNISRIF